MKSTKYRPKNNLEIYHKLSFTYAGVLEVKNQNMKCKIYLLFIPRYENANIFGANWLTTEWYPSRQLVCCIGDACFIPLERVVECLTQFVVDL